MRSRRTRDSVTSTEHFSQMMPLYFIRLYLPKALIVLDRPENARAEQTVALGLEGTVVDGLRLLDLAVGPGQNLLRGRDRDPDLVEDLSRSRRIKKIHNLLVHRLLLACRSRAGRKFENLFIRGRPARLLGQGADARRSRRA